MDMGIYCDDMLLIEVSEEDFGCFFADTRPSHKIFEVVGDPVSPEVMHLLHFRGWIFGSIVEHYSR
jgi:hypothetical protein